MTNAEKIRQLTDEELAKMFDKLIQDCEYCPLYETCVTTPNETCRSMYLKWLKNEEKDDWNDNDRAQL